MKNIKVCPFCNDDFHTEIVDTDSWEDGMIEFWHCKACQKVWRGHYNIELIEIEVPCDIPSHPKLVGLKSFGFGLIEENPREKFFFNSHMGVTISFDKILRLTTIKTTREKLEFNEPFWEAFNNEKMVAFTEDNE